MLENFDSNLLKLGKGIIMLRIIVLLGLSLLFANAANCDFSSESQRDCEIDIHNPPLMLHKFADSNSNAYAEYRVCRYGGSIEMNQIRYEVLDCSMVESKSGHLTEGVSITNSANLIKNKNISIKQNNVLLRVAGDFIIDSGVRINHKNPKNFVIEIIEGTNTRSNLVLERGASLRISSLVMPEGDKSSVWLNTFYGGAYEREFIDIINQTSPSKRGEMDTWLNVNDMFSLSKNGDRALSYNGNIICGPEINPLELKTSDYTLKRLFRTKNYSLNAPNDTNAVCIVREGGCFDNIIDFSNQVINSKSYKVATAQANLIPTYEIFIESGKITSTDGRNIPFIAPNAKIQGQNFGKCGVPTKLAFDSDTIDEYLQSNNLHISQIPQTLQSDISIRYSSVNVNDSFKPSTKPRFAISNGAEATAEIATQSSNEPIATAESSMPKATQQQIDNKPSEQHSPLKAEIQAELDKNVKDLLATFGIEQKPQEAKTTQEPQVMAEETKEEPQKSQEIEKETSKDLAKATELAQDSEQIEDAMQDSTQDLEQDSAQIADSAKKETPKDEIINTLDEKQGAKIVISSKNKTAESSDKSDEDAYIEYVEEYDDFGSKLAAIEQGSQEVKATKSQKSTKTAQADGAKKAKTPKKSPQKAEEAIELPNTEAGKGDFFMVEKEAYDKMNKKCYGDFRCIRKSLVPYDGVVWSKKSSREKVSALYLVNVSNKDLNLVCEMRNYYGKNIKSKHELNASSRIDVIDMKFETSYDRTQIVCKSRNTTKSTNKIIVTPAKFDLKYSFEDDDNNEIPTLKAGNIKILFDDSRALTLEGDVDNGFNGNLIVKNLQFTQGSKCEGKANYDITAPENLKLRFKKGYLQNAHATINANTIAFGRLNIDFKIANDDKTCVSESSNNLMPQCVSANIAKNISIIPANFRIKTDILTGSNSKIAYYGQIDDKKTFRFNPILDIDIEALDSKSNPININSECNYGSVELSLKTNEMIEFKRSSSDRLNSRVIAYLSDFERPTGTNIQAYFGISKIIDKYKNTRKITQGDVAEPREVTLMDLRFNVRYRNGLSKFDYDNVEVYDRLDENSKPLGMLFVRGKLQTNDIRGDTQNAPSLIAKYAIYCKSCDKRLLMRYLQNSLEIESQHWYINNKHPSELYLGNEFIIQPQDGRARLEILNSKSALDGRQQIIFKSKKIGIYPIIIAQQITEFAPYLSYNENYKNTHITNSFDVMIADPSDNE